MDLIYSSIRSFSRRIGERLEGGGGNVSLASCEYYFFKGHENLVQHQINITSIIERNISEIFNVCECMEYFAR